MQKNDRISLAFWKDPWVALSSNPMEAEQDWRQQNQLEGGYDSSETKMTE